MLSDNDLIQARHRLAAGRILATKQFPYYQTAMMSMVTVEMPGLGKFAVDKRWRLYFDPALCLRWSPEEIAAEWIHNVEHIIRKHEERFNSLEGLAHDHQVYNAAADAAINSELKSQGIIMPDPETRFYAEKNQDFPTWKKSMSAEEMYFSARGASAFGDEIEDNDTQPGQNPESETKDESQSSPEDEKSPSGNTPEDSEKENEESDSDDKKQDKDKSSDEKTSKDSQDKGDSSSQPGEEEDAESPSEASGDDSAEDDPKSTREASEEDPDGSGGESESLDGSPPTSDKEGDEKKGSSSDDSDGDPASDADQSSKDDDIQLHRDNSVDSGDLQEIGDEQDSTQDKSLDGNSEFEGEGSPSENGKPSFPDCGSAVGGPPRDYERKDDEEDGSVDPSTANSLLEKTAKEIENYANRHPGKVPGGLLREAKNILEPQIDWMDEFLALFRSVVAKISGYSNYSYARPSRRSSGSDFIMPILRNPPAPETAIVLDTSGSMDESKEIAMALAEMEDILNRVAKFSETQSVKVINCDAAATSVVALRDMNDFEIIGGGGTDMRVGIKAAAEIKPRMDIILIITDGGTPWPKDIPVENPHAHYIVLLVGKDAKRNKALPEWMNVIEVKIPQKRFGLKIR